MNKIVSLLLITLSTACFGKAIVTNVDVKQQYPRNGKVDIYVTMSGSADEIADVECAFVATNITEEVSLKIDSVAQEGEDVGSEDTWTRHYVWDAEEDVGKVKINQTSIAVSIVEGVQLWEGGPYWAECNVGASKPEEYGYCFWWGDTEGYVRQRGNMAWVSVVTGEVYSFVTCPTTGQTSSQLLSAGYIDSTGNLAAKHDAATSYLGSLWRMPTYADYSTLLNNCTTSFTTRNGVSGCLVVGNGAYASKSIFLPAAGNASFNYHNAPGRRLSYWSSTPFGRYAWWFYYNVDSASEGVRMTNSTSRDTGGFVRGLREFDSTMPSVSAVMSLDTRDIQDPIITPASETIFVSSLTISMSCDSEGATIHYTTDGSEPTMESPTYKRFRVNGKTTVKARAFYDDGTGSEIVTAEYALGQCPEPVISTTGGETFYHKGNQVSIVYDCEEGVVHYTTDGSEPTAESPIYTAPFVIDESTVVKAKAFSEKYFDSQVVTATLTREWEAVATPVISADDSFSGSKTKVSIACATEGVLIRYTTDGSEPNSHSKRYSGPFEVRETTTVKAYAILADYTNSEVVAKTITKNWGIGDSVGLPDHKFTTEGESGWVDDSGVMKSGAVTHNQTSSLKSTFVGKGTLAFEVKLACEEDDPPEYIEFDHYELWIAGACAYKMDGEHDWTAYSYDLGEGSHEIEWRYVKDEQDDPSTPDPDGVWLRNIVWSPEKTQASEVKVELAWLKTYFPSLGSYYFDYEEKANETAANGNNKVWEAYLIGLDPTDSAAKFVSSIAIEDSKPVVSWDPDLGGARAYTILGSTDLKTWTKVEEGRASDYNFFKVSVEMK